MNPATFAIQQRVLTLVLTVLMLAGGLHTFQGLSRLADAFLELVGPVWALKYSKNFGILMNGVDSTLSCWTSLGAEMK